MIILRDLSKDGHKARSTPDAGVDCRLPEVGPGTDAQFIARRWTARRETLTPLVLGA